MVISLLRRLGLMPARPSSPPAAAPVITVTQAERRALSDAARSLFGFADLLPGQAEILTCVRRGEHMLAILPTGAGKSLCYQLPAFLDTHGLTLVVSPLIALMKDQVDGLPVALRPYALAINSQIGGDAFRRALQRLAAGQIRLLYVAPERLRHASFVSTLARAGVSRLVVDEAHCVSMWGHDFRPDYLHLRQVHRDLGSPPLLAMTATAPPTVRVDIERQLLGGTGSMRVLIGDTFRRNLHLRVLRVHDDDERTALLLRLLASLRGCGIIYAKSRRRCEELAALLRQQGYAAAHYHARMENRTDVQDRFMRGDVQIVVATVAFGMGIDKGDIRFILHDGLPASLESYYQEIGRAGRDGGMAHCVLLYTDHDATTQLRLAARTPLTLASLRALYWQIRRVLGAQSSGLVARAALEPTAGNATSVRVGLSLLEEAGLLRRTYDAPQTATFHLPKQTRGAHDAMFMTFVRRCGLDTAQGATVDFPSLAAAMKMSPAVLERWLAAWQEERYLSVHLEVREPFIELTAVPAQADEHLARLLQARVAAEEQRVSEIVQYARAAGCRHGFLAEHLGGVRRAKCDACDNCGAPFALSPAPSPTPAFTPTFTSTFTSADAEAHRLIILQALAEQRWGRRNLVRLLHGDSGASEHAQQARVYGALRMRNERSIDQLLESLLVDGLIQPHTLAHGGVVLALTRSGERVLDTLTRQKRSNQCN